MSSRPELLQDGGIKDAEAYRKIAFNRFVQLMTGGPSHLVRVALDD